DLQQLGEQQRQRRESARRSPRFRRMELGARLARLQPAGAVQHRRRRLVLLLRAARAVVGRKSKRASRVRLASTVLWVVVRKETEIESARRLKRMQRFATGLLVGMALLFVAASLLHERYPF